MCSFDRADVLLELVLANGTVAAAGGDTAALRYLTFMHVCVCISITRDNRHPFPPIHVYVRSRSSSCAEIAHVKKQWILAVVGPNEKEEEFIHLPRRGATCYITAFSC